MAWSLTIFPFAFIFVAIRICHGTLAVEFVIGKIARVDCAISKSTDSMAWSLIIFPLAYILWTIGACHGSLAIVLVAIVFVIGPTARVDWSIIKNENPMVWSVFPETIIYVG